MKRRIAVLISGEGTNLQALIDAAKSNRLEADITLVASNRRDAFGLTRARNAAIPTLYFPLRPYRDAGLSREIYDAHLAEKIAAFHPDLIVLAGWMHVFSPAFLNCFPDRVINLHPALPGHFAGTHAIQRAYEAYQRGEIDHSGCMVHYVAPEVDAGPVIASKEVGFMPDDSLSAFENRMHETEHTLIVDAVSLALARIKE